MKRERRNAPSNDAIHMDCLPINTICCLTSRVLVNHSRVGRDQMSDTVVGKKKRKARKGSKKVAKKLGVKKSKRRKKK